MKYNDKSAKKWREREVNKDAYPTKSDRNTRRETERNLVSFALKVYKYVDREWWDSFTLSEKLSIVNEWGSNLLTGRTYGSEPQPFDEWIRNVRKKKMPNLSTYREKKIESLIKNDTQNRI